MTGFGKRSMAVKTRCPRSAVSLPVIGFIVASSLMSAPATNAFSPPPVRITARTASSLRTYSNASPISATVCAFSAFRTFGRSMVMIAIASRTSTFTFSIASSLPVERHRLLACVIVETCAGLAAEAAGQHHFAEQRRRRETLLLVFGVHHVGDVVSRIESDEIEQRERTHRIAAAEHHRFIDVLDRADAFLVCTDGIEDVRHEQTVDDEAGVVAARHRLFAERFRERERGIERL